MKKARMIVAIARRTVGLAPEKAVKQLRKILPPLFEYLLKAPAATPVLFSKSTSRMDFGE